MSDLSVRLHHRQGSDGPIRGLYLPLHLRMACFYALLLVCILTFFGIVVYQQARQQAYKELDNALSSRAAGVLLGKDLTPEWMAHSPFKYPLLLPGDSGIGIGGISIEVLNTKLELLATTTGTLAGGTSISGQATSPAPWDLAAARAALQGKTCPENKQVRSCLFSTITYQGQQVRVYTLLNDDPYPTPHLIQTARSTSSVEQSLANLLQIIVEGSLLALLLALVGGWLIARGVLSTVQRITNAARAISAAQDFGKRVAIPMSPWRARDEFSVMSETFNTMLANLEEVYRRQQRFVADASHELRAPITSIRCNLDLLTKAPDLPPEEVNAALIDTHAEAERMGRLVNDLLTLARTDSQPPVIPGHRTTRYSPLVELDSLVLEAFRQYRHVGESNAPYPRLLLQHTEPAQIYGDADALKQALIALLDNALKYTPSTGSVTLALHAHTSEQGKTACITVSDTGIGIAKEDLPHIFERFYRADHARTRDKGGSGLGLAIVQRIAEDHLGSVKVESTPGKGSQFTLCFPIAGDEH